MSTIFIKEVQTFTENVNLHINKRNVGKTGARAAIFPTSRV